MVGLPGSGKSTWIKNQSWSKNCAVVSTDFHVESYAASVNKSYSEVFELYNPFAVKMMVADIEDAVKANKDIIWDQTSTTIASRFKKFKLIPHYRCIAVEMPHLPQLALSARLLSRPNKVIPQEVIEKLMHFYESPTIDEGFSEIWKVTQG